MRQRTGRPSIRSRTGRTRHGGSAALGRRSGVWALFLAASFLGAPELRGQPIADLEGGTPVVVTADHGPADACGRLFRVRPLSEPGELPDSIADPSGETFLCVPLDLRVWRQVGSGDSARFEAVDVDEIEVGVELDVWTRGVAFPTNPPRLRAETIRIRPPRDRGR